MTARSKRALERTLADNDGNAECEVDAELLARIEDAVRRMPRRQREIFLAVRLDNLSYAEIAERTGLGASEVERHFANSLVFLADTLDRPTREPLWKRLFRG